MEEIDCSIYNVTVFCPADDQGPGEAITLFTYAGMRNLMGMEGYASLEIALANRDRDTLLRPSSSLTDDLLRSVSQIGGTSEDLLHTLRAVS